MASRTRRQGGLIGRLRNPRGGAAPSSPAEPTTDATAPADAASPAESPRAAEPSTAPERPHTTPADVSGEANPLGEPEQARVPADPHLDDGPDSPTEIEPRGLGRDAQARRQGLQGRRTAGLGGGADLLLGAVAVPAADRDGGADRPLRRVSAHRQLDARHRARDRPRLDGRHGREIADRRRRETRAAPARCSASASSPRCGRPPATSARSCARPTASTTSRRPVRSGSCARAAADHAGDGRADSRAGDRLRGERLGGEIDRRRDRPRRQRRDRLEHREVAGDAADR